VRAYPFVLENPELHYPYATTREVDDILRNMVAVSNDDNASNDIMQVTVSK